MPATSPLAIHLRASVATLTRRLRSALPTEQVSLAGLSVLGLLHRHGRLTPTELAAHEGVRLQTLTRLLAQLESAGFVARKPSAADARQTVVSLARRGSQLLATHVHRREASLAAALESFTARERDTLQAACLLIDRLSDTLAAAEVAA